MMIMHISCSILLLTLFGGPSLAVPTAHVVQTSHNSRAVLQIPFMSHIAIGESYASGVGAGMPDKTYLASTCLRCDQAYPRVLARDPVLPGQAQESRLTNNACSGQTIPEILESQFGDQETGDFKPFGQPQFATISAAGDDIQFKELAFSCLYESPFKGKKCQDQIRVSKGIIQSDTFPSSIRQLIKETLDKGRVNYQDFRIYYLSYARFFNTEATEPDYCSQRTWSKCILTFVCEKLTLTVDLRNQLNELSVLLNGQIEAAVKSFSTERDSKGIPFVKYVNIDDIVEGHRYCEQGKKEPVNNDPDVWFNQWGDDLANDGVQQFYDLVAQKLGSADAATLNQEMFNGLRNVSVKEIVARELEVARENEQLANQLEFGDAILSRAQTLHPKTNYHQLIEERLRNMVIQDFGSDTVASTDIGSFETS